MSDERMTTAEIYAGFMQSRLTAQRSPATIAWYEQMLAPLVAYMPGEPHIIRIEAWLGATSTAATARARLRATRAMFNWAERRFGIPSPAAAIIPPRPNNKLPRVFTAGELRRIFAEAAKDSRDLAAVTVLLDTGVRIGELASLRTELISSDEIQVRGKTGDRRVPITPEARAALMRIAPPMGPVFNGWPGRPPAGGLAPFGPNVRPMTTATLKDRIRRLVERAGVRGEKTGPHTFRHTFATMYLRGGGSLFHLRDLMGHESIKQTQVYLHLSNPEAFAEHARLSPLRQFRGA